jgi:hypothetical protein
LLGCRASGYPVASLPSICELSPISITMLTFPSGEIQQACPIQYVDYWAFIEYGCAHYQYDELEEFIRVRFYQRLVRRNTSQV